MSRRKEWPADLRSPVGVYFVLREDKKSEYLNIRANNSIRDWFKKWFYVGTAETDEVVMCDVTKIPEQHEKWTSLPRNLDQVQELLKMYDRCIDGIYVAGVWMSRRVQPCKERVHPMFEYTGSQDPTREADGDLSNADLNERLG